ncbi:MAG: ribosomal protein S18-alanine N-acetyltransferase [Selenomonadaceae bacterium]|nr:ribosomal protein S18-alanine N-acetyltransferase [Selenomonadaceae bacterium]
MGEKARTEFRKLTPDDAEIVAELDFKCFGANDACNSKYFFKSAQDERKEFWVCEHDGKIIACAGAEINSDTAEIESLAVDPEYRRQGIATILLIKLINAIKKRGATFIILEVRPSNKAAIELYKGFGFQIVEREKDYYLDEDAWIMAREFLDGQDYFQTYDA